MRVGESFACLSCNFCQEEDFCPSVVVSCARLIRPLIKAVYRSNSAKQIVVPMKLFVLL